MRIAAIYDIHANPIALKTVLAEIENYNVDLIIVGGDVVSGPLPKETLRLIQEVPKPIKYILGNAESEVLRYLQGEKIGGLSQRANDEAKWVATQLTAEDVGLIKGWAKDVTIKSNTLGTLFFCHGTPRSDVEIFTKITPDKTLEQIFETVNASVVVCGHTHIPFDRVLKNIRIVNAGSVGMPFVNTGADWLLIDRDIHFKHTDYDLEEAAKQILNSNYPYAESFVSNNVLTTPSESDALQMLSTLEQNQNFQ